MINIVREASPADRRNENFLLQNSENIGVYAIPTQGHFYTFFMVGSKLHFYAKTAGRVFF
ncbi:MAG: hypothetical protein ABT12_00065 [Paludibacter sp. SCN 51-9]|nr:MAG: hypothetical protein ABT12_00065 [Paludibacter sp. SCN 51-9]